MRFIIIYNITRISRLLGDMLMYMYVYGGCICNVYACIITSFFIKHILETMHFIIKSHYKYSEAIMEHYSKSLMSIIQLQQVSGDSRLAVVRMRLNTILARSSGRDLARVGTFAFVSAFK